MAHYQLLNLFQLKLCWLIKITHPQMSFMVGHKRSSVRLNNKLVASSQALSLPIFDYQERVTKLEWIDHYWGDFGRWQTVFFPS